MLSRSDYTEVPCPPPTLSQCLWLHYGSHHHTYDLTLAQPTGPMLPLLRAFRARFENRSIGYLAHLVSRTCNS